MKVLVFHIGAQRYGVRLTGLRQVVAVAALKELPLAPPYVAGLLDLHGSPVPVIDLAQRAGLAPACVRFDTRILVADYAVGEGSVRALGLLVERVEAVQEIDPGQLCETGVRAAPFLGQVVAGSGALLQLVEIGELLPPDVQAILFPLALA
jgi:chemotaxis-related protein WspB